jgi:hypothetical protein
MQEENGVMDHYTVFEVVSATTAIVMMLSVVHPRQVGVLVYFCLPNLAGYLRTNLTNSPAVSDVTKTLDIFHIYVWGRVKRMVNTIVPGMRQSTDDTGKLIGVDVI